MYIGFRFSKNMRFSFFFWGGGGGGGGGGGEGVWLGRAHKNDFRIWVHWETTICI